MSDPTTDEDSLISQDDIDKLMESSSIEEAEDKISEDMEDLGELSQDDIDSLLNSNTESADDGDIDPDDDMELISQDDIDSLMNASDDDMDSEEDPDSDDEIGELSQDDIDSLMNTSTDDIVEETESADADEEDEIGELSQDDIDSLMNASSMDEIPDADDDLEMISQADVEGLLNEGEKQSRETPSPGDETAAQMDGNTPAEETETNAGSDDDNLDTGVAEVVDSEPEAPAPASKEPPEPENIEKEDGDWIIEESEAVEAQACIVQQATIDDLIADFDPTPDTEPIILDDEPEPETADEADAEPEAETESDMALESAEDDLDIPGLDEPVPAVDETLGDDSDVTVLDFDEEDEDVTQEDIDALLLEGDDDEEDDDILISQDDIDTLLMAADDEDEDVLGDLMNSEEDTSIEDDFDDEDILDSAGEEFEEEDEAQDQVVLEGDDEPPAIKTKKKTKQKRKAVLKPGWYKSKLVIACAAALIVLGITVPITYFLFFKSAPQTAEPIRMAGQPMTPQPMANPPMPALPETGMGTNEPGQPAMQTVDVVVQQPAMKTSGNLILKDFVVLAPSRAKEVSYVSLDLSIDYSDQRAYHEIQDNLAFYRDLIYDSVKKRLAKTKNQEEVTEADILLVIENTLKKVLPGNYIDRVSFKSFNIT